jgi:glycosyltransferase involved in cell wall biosynthesis
MLKIAVCCCTYNRPHLLGELIHSFEIQTYPKSHCELVILDDAGQYGDINGENWQIVSFPRRFASLGEKRNACVSLTLPESDYFLVADDDDIYFPWWIESHAENFERGAKWSFASSVYWLHNNVTSGQWTFSDEDFLLHPAHGFSKQKFWELGGYPHLAGWEDWFLFEKFRTHGIQHQDALNGEKTPYMVYRHFDTENHMTGMKIEQYREQPNRLPRTKLEIGWKKCYTEFVQNFDKT